MLCFRGEFEWIENLNVKGFKVLSISGGYDQGKHAGRCGNHGIGREIGGAAVHKAGPLAEDGPVGRQDRVTALNVIDPSLQFRRFLGVLFTRELNTGLRFGEEDTGDGKLMNLDRTPPSKDRSVRAGFAQFGDDVRVEQIVHRCSSSSKGNGRNLRTGR